MYFLFFSVFLTALNAQSLSPRAQKVLNKFNSSKSISCKSMGKSSKALASQILFEFTNYDMALIEAKSMPSPRVKSSNATFKVSKIGKKDIFKLTIELETMGSKSSKEVIEFDVNSYVVHAVKVKKQQFENGFESTNQIKLTAANEKALAEFAIQYSPNGITMNVLSVEVLSGPFMTKRVLGGQALDLQNFRMYSKVNYQYSSEGLINLNNGRLIPIEAPLGQNFMSRYFSIQRP